MKYILEGHEMKHAAEEMLLHLLPTETLTRVETEQDGDICISARLSVRGRPRDDRRRDACREHSCPDGGTG